MIGQIDDDSGTHGPYFSIIKSESDVAAGTTPHLTTEKPEKVAK